MSNKKTDIVSKTFNKMFITQIMTMLIGIIGNLVDGM